MGLPGEGIEFDVIPQTEPVVPPIEEPAPNEPVEAPPTKTPQEEPVPA